MYHTEKSPAYLETEKTNSGEVNVCLQCVLATTLVVIFMFSHGVCVLIFTL